MSKIILLAVLVAFAIACNGQPTTNTEVQEKFSKGISDFTVNFLKELVKKNPGQSVFASPFSVEVPLGELGLYSQDEGLQQLLKVLNLSSKDEIRSAFRTFLDDAKTVKDIAFSLAAKVYVNEDYPMSDAFAKDTKEVFDSEAETFDASDAAGSAAKMNKWVEDQTNNRIKDLVPQDAINELTRLVLLNAIYFKAQWKYQFNKNDTVDRDFYVTKDQTKQVKMMYQENENFRYGESTELNAQVLQMPYSNENFSLYIVLPKEKEGLQSSLNNLNGDNLNKAFSSLSKRKVQVWMPTWETTSTIDLAEILQSLGVTKIFDQTDSDLEGLLKSNEPLSVTKALQKSFVKVDEEGSEAAAANAVDFATYSMPVSSAANIDFVADHSFIYIVSFRDIISFSGIYCG